MHSVVLQQNKQSRPYISLEIKFGINFNDDASCRLALDIHPPHNEGQQRT
jgi:hypothetical protein